MGTMRPDKYDGTKAYRVCHEFIPPDGVDCGSTLQWKGVRSSTTIKLLKQISQDRKQWESSYDKSLSIFDDISRQWFTRKKRPKEHIPENGRQLCQFYEIRDQLQGYSQYVSVFNSTRAIGFNRKGNQIRSQKQKSKTCYMFFKCELENDKECLTFPEENGKYESDHINSVNTGQSNSNNNNKNIASNNNNKINGNKNGKRPHRNQHGMNKKSQQIPNMENGKPKSGVGKRDKGKKRNINKIEKLNSNNGSSSSSSSSPINNYKQLQIYEPDESNRRHNSLPKQQASRKRQQKLNARSRPVRHSQHRNHHQQQPNTEDKVAQMFENLKK